MVNFPSSFDDDTTLYVAVNNLRTRLTAGIGTGDTTIPVITTSGYISILTGGDITKTEAISYTNTTSNSFTGATRGAGGTVAYSHNSNDNVDLTILADHHNELKNAIINLEHFVGISGSENFLPLDDSGNAAVPGNLGVAGALSIQDSATVSGGATFYFATITGSLSVGSYITAVGTISGSEIKAPAAEFDTLVVNQESTVSGSPVMIDLPGTISLSTIYTSNIYASTSMTISGEPVSIGGGGSALTIKESDGVPTVTNVDTIVVSNGSLVDDGGGQVTIQTGAGGGGSLTVQEQDGVPTVTGVNTIKVTNTTLTDEGSGVISLDTGGALTTSGYWLNPNVRPVHTTSWSDFFDDNSTNPTLSGRHWIDWSKWSLWDVDTVSGSLNGQTDIMYSGPGDYYDTNFMQVHHDASTPNGWVGFYQDVPSGDFTITTKVGYGTYYTNANFRIGIFVADDLDASPSTADLFSCHIHVISGETSASNYSQYQAGNWTSYNNMSSSSQTTAGPYPGMSAWLKIRYYSGTTLEAAISNDGLHFRELWRNSSLSFTPNKLGFGIENGGGAITASFEFVAIIDYPARESPAGHGQLVPFIIS